MGTMMSILEDEYSEPGENRRYKSIIYKMYYTTSYLRYGSLGKRSDSSGAGAFKTPPASVRSTYIDRIHIVRSLVSGGQMGKTRM